jgi:hypothetical protein
VNSSLISNGWSSELTAIAAGVEEANATIRHCGGTSDGDAMLTLDRFSLKS